MRWIQGFLAIPLVWLVAAGGPAWAEGTSQTEGSSTERAKPALPEAAEERGQRFHREWPEGKVFKDFDGGPSMLVIKGMRGEDIHGLAVSRGKVTVALYNECVKEGSCEPIASLPLRAGNAIPEEADNAGNRAVRLTWAAEQRYVRWLRRKTGFDYRTMTQREFNARGLPVLINKAFDWPFHAGPGGAKPYGFGMGNMWRGSWKPLLPDYLDFMSDPDNRLQALLAALDRVIEEARGFRVARPLVP